MDDPYFMEYFRSPISFSSEKFDRHEGHGTTERGAPQYLGSLSTKLQPPGVFIGLIADKGPSDHYEGVVMMVYLPVRSGEVKMIGSSVCPRWPLVEPH